MQTSQFKTRTIFLDRENKTSNNYWPVALDVGYSSVKIFSPTKIACFPSFAKEADPNASMLSDPLKTDIQYRDKDGVWNVGATALKTVDDADTSDSISSLYGRNRYFSPMFKVISRVGIAIGMIARNDVGPNGKTIVLQTGLPPKYIKSDSKHLRESLTGVHDFEIRIGAGKWTRFTFSLPAENIRIMPQPMGSLISASTDKNGKKTADADKLVSSNSKVLIMDAGFGTNDLYYIRNGTVTLDDCETFPNLSMRRVFKETTDEILKRYEKEIPVSAFQNYLEKGTVDVFNKMLRETTEESFAEILDEKSKEICYKALDKIDEIYDYLQNCNYFIVTGGTGAAWIGLVKERYANMRTLAVMGANQNDELPHIFSNVRGYYFYLVGKLEE